MYTAVCGNASFPVTNSVANSTLDWWDRIGFPYTIDKRTGDILSDVTNLYYIGE